MGAQKPVTPNDLLKPLVEDEKAIGEIVEKVSQMLRARRNEFAMDHKIVLDASLFGVDEVVRGAAVRRFMSAGWEVRTYHERDQMEFSVPSPPSSAYD